MSTLTVHPRGATSPLLRRFQATPIVTSSNRADHLVNGSWAMMLPAMDLRRLLHIGRPADEWLETLPRSCSSVTVVISGAEGSPKSNGHVPFRVITPEGLSRFLAEESQLDCVYVADTALGTRLLGDRTIADRLRNILGSRGALFVAGRLSCTPTLGMQGFVTSEYWVTSRTGALRTAFPVEQHDLSQFAFRQVLHGNSKRNRLLSRTGSILSRAGLLPLVARRRAQLLRPARAGQGSFQLPDYLVAAGDDAGIDLRKMRWAMSARGRYDSNKTIFYLFPERVNQPEIVVKITRTPEFNHRLEHEYAVLRSLRDSGVTAVPEPLFIADHNELKISAQRAVMGTPLRAVDDETVRSRAVRSMVDLLVQLGAAGYEAFGSARAAECDVFGTIAARCADVYTLPSAQRTFLEQQAKSIAESGDALPLVLQHGDTGAWNLIVGEDGRVTLLDWENAEAPGVPLWDLLHFLFTIDRRHGSVPAGSDVFLVSHNANRLVVLDALQNYLRSVAVPRKLLEPLFYLCWAYRAVRESWYLPANGLDGGIHIRMLRAALAGPAAVSALMDDLPTTRHC